MKNIANLTVLFMICVSFSSAFQMNQFQWRKSIITCNFNLNSSSHCNCHSRHIIISSLFNSNHSDDGPKSRKKNKSRAGSRLSRSRVTKRAPHQFDHTKEEARPFIDTLSELSIQSSSQPSNENEALIYNLKNYDNLDRQSLSLKCLSFDLDSVKFGAHVEKHVEMMSLDEIFPQCNCISEKFSHDGMFRNALRAAMREDVFDSTPSYLKLSPKARQMLLLPDSSLQGSWKCQQKDDFIRMKKLSKVLRDAFGTQAPSGDEFMNSIGALCGDNATTHWIDIVGVLDRRIPHSWHQDTGRIQRSCDIDAQEESRRQRKTVMLGFPAVDDYNGVGVFSHVIKLRREAHAAEDHPDYEPVVYQGTVSNEYIVRPRFAQGREVMVYRDIDVLHSAPDVAYRSSVMRFM